MSADSEPKTSESKRTELNENEQAIRQLLPALAEFEAEFKDAIGDQRMGTLRLEIKVDRGRIQDIDTFFFRKRQPNKRNEHLTRSRRTA
jgi:hypothetical protein